MFPLCPRTPASALAVGVSRVPDLRCRVGGSSGLGETGQGTFNVLDLGLSFTCDGKLWLSAGSTGSLWQVDPETAATTKVGNLGVTITGLTARGNQLFGAGSCVSPPVTGLDSTILRRSFWPSR